MKKQIIALAVAGAISAPAMADITLGADFAFGYESTSNSADGTDDGGFGWDTSEINLSSKTELDNGMTVSGSLGAEGFSRGSTVTGLNSSLAVSGDFGTIRGAVVEAGSGIRGLGGAGAPVNNMEGEVLIPAVNIDSVSYTTPMFGPVNIYVGHAEGGTTLGSGETGSSQQIGANLKVGMLTAKGDYTAWQDNSTSDDRIRVSAKVDLGSVAIGAGYEVRNFENGTIANAAPYTGDATPTAAQSAILTAIEGTLKERTNTIVGISAPISDMTTLGLNYVEAEWEFSGNGGTTLEAKGWTVGIEHALSSNLSILANYSDWEDVLSNDNTKTSILAAYSF